MDRRSECARGTPHAIGRQAVGAPIDSPRYLSNRCDARSASSVLKACWCVLRPVLALLLLAAPLRAQCPDGSQPPCGRKAAAVASAATPAPNSVAVLYFDNMSRDTADAWLAQGLTDEIIARIGEVERVSVKSRYAVRPFRNANVDPTHAGRVLNVAYMVTGSVQRAGSRLRVTVELARAGNGDRVWGEQYDRADGDVFAIQQDIARGVAVAVAGRLLPAERATLAARSTRSNEAYEHLLRGNLLLAQRTPASVRRAIGEYSAATRADSRFASAWAHMSLAYGVLATRSWTTDGRPIADSIGARAIATADRALALDSSNSDVWMAQAYTRTLRDPKGWSGVEDGYRRAVALNPRNAEAWHQLGEVLGVLGRASESREAYRRALAAEPGRPITVLLTASSLSPAEAVALCDSLIAVEPSYFEAYAFRANARLAAGDTSGAREDRDRLIRVAPPGTELGARVNAMRITLATGDSVDARRRALELLRELPAEGPVHARIAALLAGALYNLGERDAAVSLLERAPRGMYLWQSRNAGRWGEDERVKRLFAESRP